MNSNKNNELYTSVEMCVEIPYGSNVKYEIKDGKIICDRVLHTPMSYPFNYGYLTDTLADDGDELDAVLLTPTAFVPQTYIQVKIIGALLTEDEKGKDEKIIVVPVDKVDPRYKAINDISDIAPDVREQIFFFFNYYKILEKEKWIKIDGYVEREEAIKIYHESKIKHT